MLCITNRSICSDDFLTRIEKIAKSHPKGIILREKDLDNAKYAELAAAVLKICKEHTTECILHSHICSAKELDCHSLHVPMHILRSMSSEDRRYFTTLGASCHSERDAIDAQSLGCTYITVGHIFDTQCKKGLPGRGTELLKNICKKVDVPVYAIGGINPQNILKIQNAGASGFCVMSGVMSCKDIERYFSEFEDKLDEI